MADSEDLEFGSEESMLQKHKKERKELQCKREDSTKLFKNLMLEVSSFSFHRSSQYEEFI